MNSSKQEILNSSIVALLKQHSCVVVPGLGGFLTANKPSYLDNQQQLIFPSGKNISFNVQLQHNDGLLIHYIAQQQQLTFIEAEEWLKDEVTTIKNTLHDGNTIRLNDLGKLKLNDENNFVFTALSHNTLSLNSYGLKPVALPERNKAIANEGVVIELIEESKILNEKQDKKTKSSKTWYALAMIALAFLTISQIIYFNAKENVITFQHLSIASIFDAAMNNKKPLVKGGNSVMKEKKLMTIQQKPIQAPAIQEHITTINSQEIKKGYYAIVGSFKNFENAQNKLSSINKQKVSSQIIPTEEGNYRVGIYISDKISDVRISIKTYRALYNKQAWIMHNL